VACSNHKIGIEIYNKIWEFDYMCLISHKMPQMWNHDLPSINSQRDKRKLYWQFIIQTETPCDSTNTSQKCQSTPQNTPRKSLYSSHLNTSYFSVLAAFRIFCKICDISSRFLLPRRWVPSCNKHHYSVQPTGTVISVPTEDRRCFFYWANTYQLHTCSTYTQAVAI